MRYLKYRTYAHTEFEDVISPQSLALYFLDIVGSTEEAQIDVRSSTIDDYDHSIHCTDTTRVDFAVIVAHASVSLRLLIPIFSRSNAVTDLIDVEPSFDERRIDIVAQTVHKLWRAMYQKRSFDDSSAVDHPS